MGEAHRRLVLATITNGMERKCLKLARLAEMFVRIALNEVSSRAEKEEQITNEDALFRQ